MQSLQISAMPIVHRVDNFTLEQWTSEPSEVLVTLPADLASRIRPDTAVIARLDDKTLRDMDPGVPQSAPVKLMLPAELQIAEFLLQELAL